MIKQIKESDLQAVIKDGRPVLVDFYADWCGPCRMMAPILAELADEHGEIIVGKVNVDEEEALAAAYGVFSIPTLVLLKDGKEVGRMVGARPKEEVLRLLDR